MSLGSFSTDLTFESFEVNSEVFGAHAERDRRASRRYRLQELFCGAFQQGDTFFSVELSTLILKCKRTFNVSSYESSNELAQR